MILIRKTEEKIAEGRKSGLIKGPVHLGAGQEAIAVGISQHLRNSDRVFGAHRSHAHLLALNPNPYKLFAEVLARSTGFSKGMGGSMHLWDQSSGFFGSVPIVGGTVSLAVGAALAASFDNKGEISLCYLGDGAMEEGVVHESFNLAKVTNAPVLFVVENNFFASHMHIDLRQSFRGTVRFAEANDISNAVVDGNDVVKVGLISKQMISEMRARGGPGFIEAVTHRKYGHVDWRQDVDVGLNRSESDLQLWSKRDPILRMKLAIEEHAAMNFSVDEIEERIDEIVLTAWDRSVGDPEPDLQSITRYVFQA